jgi:predicted anti-sigma-YlaC factor YlaD
MRFFVYPSCRESHELLSRQRDGRTRPLQRLRLNLHLATCRGCRRMQRQFDLLGRAVRRMGA